MPLSKGRTRIVLPLETQTVREIRNAARNAEPVAGLTHTFYKYPARFSPNLVRAAIRAFTEPGDVVFDPFVGGGTTLVEALSLGRIGIGTDISALATFVSEVKTTLYSDSALEAVSEWAERVVDYINLSSGCKVSSDYEETDYLRHLDNPQTWRIRKAIGQALESATRLRTAHARQFARCVILRTAQWALDGRRVFATVPQFRQKLREHSLEMIAGARELRDAALAYSGADARCIQRSTAGLEQDPQLRHAPRPRLVVTSPPYPGVHVLYHRWQISGGRETPAPFWIANRLDGDGAAYYTMGDRNSRTLNKYFDQLRESLASVAAICDHRTIVVQVVAFSDPAPQLSRYLSVADEVGFEECFLSGNGMPTGARRLWRTVPNRKWYAHQKGDTTGSQEVVLFHRLKS